MNHCSEIFTICEMIHVSSSLVSHLVDKSKNCEKFCSGISVCISDGARHLSELVVSELIASDVGCSKSVIVDSLDGVVCRRHRVWR